MQEFLNCAKRFQFPGLVLFAATEKNKAQVYLGIFVGKNYAASENAGKLMAKFAPLVDGRGGGSAQIARGAGKNQEKIILLLQEFLK